MTTPLNVLILEDRAADAELMLLELRKANFEPDWQRVETEADYRAKIAPKRLAKRPLDLILADYHLPQFDGVQALQIMKECSLDIPFILVSGVIGEETAVAAMKDGADDYVLKDCLTRLGQAVVNALEDKHLRYEKQQVENALAISEAKYRSLVDFAGAGIARVDTQGRFSFVNQALCDTTGYTEQEMLGMPFADFLHPEDLGTFLEIFQGAADAPDKKLHLEFRVVHKDGHTVYCQSNPTIYREGEKIAGFNAIIEDITQRKLAEQEVRASETELHALFAAMKDVVFVTDRDGRYIKIAPTDPGGLVKPPAEMIGKTMADVMPKAKAREFVAYIRSVLDTRQTMQIEYTLPIYGQAVWFSASISPMEHDTVIWVAHDITARKRAETERHVLLEIMQGLASTKSLQEFLHLIHHSITRVIDAENISVVIHDTNTGLFEEIYTVDEFDLPMPPSKLEKSITSYVFRTAEPLLLTEEGFDELAKRGELELVGTPSACWLGAPIKTPAETIGVISVQNYENANCYSERDLEFLASVAAQVSQAIERMQAEEALEASEKRLQAIVEHSLDEVSLVTADGTLIWESPTAFRPLGYPPGTFDGRSIFDLFHPDDRVTALQTFSEVVQQSDSNREALFRLRHQDGTWRWMEGIAINLLHDPAVGAVVINYRDITERKQAEAALRKSEAELRALFAAMQDVVIIYDRQGRYLSVAPTSGSLYALASEMVGKTLQDVLPAAQADLLLEHILRALDSHSTVMVDYDLDLDGRQVWFAGAISPITEDTVVLVAHDITNRKLADKQIEESEEKFRSLFENIPDGVYRSTPDGTLLLANPALVRMLGYETEDELLGIPCKELYVDPLDRQDFVDHIQKDGVIRNVEKVLKRKDGQQVTCLDNAHVHYDEKGEITFFEGTLSDITPLKQAEEARQESEQQYRNLFENVPVGIGVSDPSGQVIAFNDALLKPGGYARQDIHYAKDLYYDPAQRAKIVTLARKKGGLYQYPVQFKRKDGTPYDILLTLTPTTFNGQPCLQALVEDVTGRKRAEDVLRASEERFRSILDNIEDGYYEVDTAGNLTFFNPGQVRILGRPANELMGMNYRLYMTPEGGKAVFQTFNRVFRTGIPEQAFDWELVHPDGTHRSVEVSVSLIKAADGSIKGFRGIVRDITERKRVEEKVEEERILLRTLIDNLPDRVFVMDVQGRKIISNTADWQASGGKTMEDVIGKTDLETYPLELAEAYWAVDKAVIDSEISIINREEPGLDSQGNPVWVLTSKVPLRDGQGKVVGLVGIGRDITERKRVEEALRQRLAELESLHTISAALRTAQTRDEALPILLDETLAALETEAGVIWLYHPEYNELRAVVTRGWFRELSETPMKSGEGIGGTVFASGQTHVSVEFRNDPLADAASREQIPDGWGGVCVPIRAGAVTIGVLYVSLLLPRQITSQQVKLLESLSNMAGATVHRMSLYEATVRQLQRLDTLRKIDQAISSVLDLRLTLNILLDQIISHMGVDAADVLLLNPHTLTLEYAAGRGFRTTGIERTQLRLGEGYAGQAALERRLVSISNLASAGEHLLRSSLLSGEDMVAYFGLPLIAKGQVKGVLEIFHRSPIDPDKEWLNFLDTLSGQAAIAIDNGQLFNGLERSNMELALAYDTTLEGWSRALDLRDKETEGHTQRVADITVQLARIMGVSEGDLVHFRRGALLHDIGKMGVPDGILFKPGSLSEADWLIMRKHPQFAYDMLSPIQYLRAALDIPYCHHEKWDGTGYPRQLKEEQIPFSARIFAVVDVWDALISDRPYRPAWSKTKALDHIREQSGKHFDPNVVTAFLDLPR